MGTMEGNGMGCGVLPHDGACKGWVCPMAPALSGRDQTMSILPPNVSIFRVVYSPCPPVSVPCCVSLRSSLGSWKG